MRQSSVWGAGLGIVCPLGIAALLNFLGDCYNFRHDMTADALFTLSDDSKRLMRTVEEEGQYVQVKTFMGEMEGMRFQDLMKEYNHQSDHFEYELVDPQKNALQVERNNIRERGTSIIEVRGDGQARSERIMQMSEEALSNAILKCCGPAI